MVCHEDSKAGSRGQGHWFWFQEGLSPIGGDRSQWFCGFGSFAGVMGPEPDGCGWVREGEAESTE